MLMSDWLTVWNSKLRTLGGARKPWTSRLLRRSRSRRRQTEIFPRAAEVCEERIVLSGAPVFGSSVTTFSVPEDAPDGQVITSTDITLTDPESDPLGFYVYEGNISDPATWVSNYDFILSEDSGYVLLELATGASLDFETTPTHNLILEANDGMNYVPFAVTVNVTDVPEAPVLGAPPAPASSWIFSIAEDAQAYDVVTSTDISVSDPQGDYVTLTLYEGNISDPSTWQTNYDFYAYENMGNVVIEVASGAYLDYETTPTHNLILEAMDMENSTTVEVTINLTDVAEEPVFGAPPAPATSWVFSIAEDAQAYDVVTDSDITISDPQGDYVTLTLYEGDVSDPTTWQTTYDFYSYEDSGYVVIEVSSGTSIDYETKSQYDLILEAMDMENATSIGVTINVTDLGAAPVIQRTDDTIPPVDILTGFPGFHWTVREDVTTVGTIKVTDADDGTALAAFGGLNQVVLADPDLNDGIDPTYGLHLTDNGDDTWSLNVTPGYDPLDYESLDEFDPTLTLLVEAWDNEQLVTTASITIIVQDVWEGSLYLGVYLLDFEDYDEPGNTPMLVSGEISDPNAAPGDIHEIDIDYHAADSVETVDAIETGTLSGGFEHELPGFYFPGVRVRARRLEPMTFIDLEVSDWKTVPLRREGDAVALETDDRPTAPGNGSIQDFKVQIMAKVNAIIGDGENYVQGLAGLSDEQRRYKLVEYVYDKLGTNTSDIIPGAVTHIEDWLEDELASDYLNEIDIEDSRYKDVPGNGFIGWAGGGQGAMAATIKVDGTLMGTDKLGHFFQQGYWLFKGTKDGKFTGSSDRDKYSQWLEGHSAMKPSASDSAGKVAMRNGFLSYTKNTLGYSHARFGVFGIWSTGVVSPADMNANEAGYQFYKALFESPLGDYYFDIDDFDFSELHEGNTNSYDPAIENKVVTS